MPCPNPTDEIKKYKAEYAALTEEEIRGKMSDFKPSVPQHIAGDMSAMPHKRWSCMLRATGRLAVVGVLVALALVPDRFLPGGQGIDVEGAFSGEPVEIQWAGEATAPYQVAIRMETGRCDVVTIDAAGTVVEQWWTQTTTYQGRIPPGGKVRLLARSGAEGYYHVRVGPLATWGPMLMGARVALLALSAAFIAAWVFGVRINRQQGDSRRRQVIAVVGATIAFSGIVVYSVVHEAGHLLFGWLWGGTPAWDRVSWTVFSGEEPHAAFHSLPPEAGPWMGAGGILLPTLVGCALLAAGFCRGGRIAWWVQLVLVTGGAALLLGNLGLFADTGHTLPLALHLGLHGAFGQIVALMPAVLTVAIYGYLGYCLRFQAQAPERVHPRAEPGAAPDPARDSASGSS